MPIPAAFDLSGRVSVVTGAGSPDGIGFATARLLAELGSAVMVAATSARIDDRRQHAAIEIADLKNSIRPFAAGEVEHCRA